jgi:hypothetical protein
LIVAVTRGDLAEGANLRYPRLRSALQHAIGYTKRCAINNTDSGGDLHAQRACRKPDGNFHPRQGASTSQSMAISEAGYSGSFTQTNSCGGTAPIATFSATSAPGPTWNLAITGVAAGTCIASVRDASGQSGTLTVTVTTSGIGVMSGRRKGR